MSGRAPAKTRRKSKGILQIARQVSATIGAEFFRALVEHLSEALAAECVYVGEFVGGQVERVKTLSASVDGQTDVAFDYPLAGSASATAALGAASACKSGARDKFREDAILSRIAAEAFVGVPLLNAHQQAVGVIMAVYRRPVSSLQVARSVLEIFAPRAAAELVRKQADEQLRESEERHRAFISSSPDGMWRVEFDPPVATDLPEKEQVERINRDGYIAECNDAVARFLGRNKAAELMGCRLSDFEQIRSESGITLANRRVLFAFGAPLAAGRPPPGEDVDMVAGSLGVLNHSSLPWLRPSMDHPESQPWPRMSRLRRWISGYSRAPTTMKGTS
jgi:PAS domain-containing protein